MDQVNSPQSPQKLVKHKQVLELQFQLFKKVKVVEKAFFANQISTMLTAGLHLTQALNLLANQTKNKFFSSILFNISRMVEEGKPLSAGLTLYPTVFDSVFVNMVKSGEASGRLSEVLGELGTQLERNASFTSKIKGAMAYPIFIIIVMVGIAILTSVKIIPSLKGIFTDAKVELPWTTKVVIAFSDFVLAWWWLLIILIVVVVALFIYSLRTKTGKEIYDNIILRDPTGLILRIYMARFTRTLGSLVKAGVPIIEAINLVSQVIGNSVYADRLAIVSKQVERGIPMSAPLQQDSHFPPFLVQMIAVGEQTGRLDESLLNMATYYERETDERIKNITTLFEPAVIVLIALGVAFLVFAVIVPIYSISQNV